MPRYIVERTFPAGVAMTADEVGAAAADALVHANAGEGVTWIHSYVTTGNTFTFCVYDGPDVDAIRRAAGATGLPVDAVTEVRVLDPYFYH